MRSPAKLIQRGSVPADLLVRRIADVQRETLVGLRDGGEVSSEVMRRLERELDLEESRLEIPRTARPPRPAPRI